MKGCEKEISTEKNPKARDVNKKAMPEAMSNDGDIKKLFQHKAHETVCFRTEAFAMVLGEDRRRMR